jgi:hypothetical protein
MRYYNILCGLAHSQWSWYINFLLYIFLFICHVCFYLYHFVLCSNEGVSLFKTTVSYQSLGESIEPFGHSSQKKKEPFGHVDNFFIAVYCRKLFDDSHPRVSRKHFFYPRIGVHILTLYFIFVFCLFYVFLSDIPTLRVKIGNALFSARRMLLIKH